MSGIPKLTINKEENRYRIIVPARYCESGKRTAIRFSTLKKAEVWRNDFLKRISKHGEVATQLSPLVVADVIEARNLLYGYNCSLADAARAWLRQNDSYQADVLSSIVWDKFVQSKKGRTRYVFHKLDRTKRAIKGILNKPIGDVTPILLEEVIRVNTNTPSMFNEAIAICSGWLNYAVKMGYVHKNVACNIPKLATPKHDISVLSVNQVKMLLGVKKIQIPVAILLFAGLRMSELKRLEWKNIDTENHKVITVDKAMSKTGSHRLVDINDTLMSWLNLVPSKDRKGLILPRNWSNLWKKARHYAEISDRDNKNPHVTRHSYASYLLALNNDINYLRSQLGHDTHDVTLRHYRARVFKGDAIEYFKIIPQEEG